MKVVNMKFIMTTLVTKLTALVIYVKNLSQNIIWKRRVNTVFAEDVMTTIDDCRRMYKDFDQMPEEVQLILCNMMFNMGYTRLGKFRKLKTNIEKQNWVGASKEMKSSKWYTQVTNRAERLVQRMASVGE